MVLEDFWDTKTNATLKSVMMLKWTLKNCDSAAWLMKTDDDVFVNLANLVKFIDTKMRDMKQILVGALNAREAVHRDSTSEKYKRFLKKKRINLVYALRGLSTGFSNAGYGCLQVYAEVHVSLR